MLLFLSSTGDKECESVIEVVASHVVEDSIKVVLHFRMHTFESTESSADRGEMKKNRKKSRMVKQEFEDLSDIAIGDEASEFSSREAKRRGHGCRQLGSY
jgi:hypothetical protein